VDRGIVDDRFADTFRRVVGNSRVFGVRLVVARVLDVRLVVARAIPPDDAAIVSHEGWTTAENATISDGKSKITLDMSSIFKSTLTQ
jgi:hypothetical protein